MLISPSQLVLAPYNPRKTFEEESLAELATSISQQGLLQPVLVRQLTPAKGKKAATYEVVCGARRTKASQLAGLEAVPCNVAELTDAQAFEAAITENLQREDVKPMEEARAFAALLESGYTLQQLADKFGKSHVHIWNRVQLAKATPDLQQAIEEGEIPITYARELARFPVEVQNEQIEEKGWRYSRTPKDFVSRILRNGVQLSTAVFDTAKRGCASCSSNAQVLGLADEAICLNREKFKQHTYAHILERLWNNHQLLPVCASWQDPIKGIDEDLRGQMPRAVVRVGHGTDWNELVEPTMPELEEPEEGDFDSAEEYQEALADARHDYDDQMEAYKCDLEVFEKKKAAGLVQGIWVGDWRFGEMVYLEPRKGTAAVADDFLSIQPERQEAEAERSKLIQKKNRIPALMAEKVYDEQIAQISELAIYKGIDSIDQPPLTKGEDDLIFMYMVAEVGYRLPRALKVLLLKNDNTINQGNIDNVLKLKNQLWPQVVRLYLANRCQPAEGKGCSMWQLQGWNQISNDLKDVDQGPIEAIKEKYAKQLDQANKRILQLEQAIELLDAAVEQEKEGGKP